MRLTIKAFFSSLVACLALLFVQQTYACGSSVEVAANLYHPGCEQLKVTIVNNTGYEFEVVEDNSQPNIGSVVSGSLNSFSTPFYIKGGYQNDTNQDVVDKTVRYSAKLNGKKTGATFLLHLTKSSCNVTEKNTTCKVNTHSCYEWIDPCEACEWMGCKSCAFCSFIPWKCGCVSTVPPFGLVPCHPDYSDYSASCHTSPANPLATGYEVSQLTSGVYLTSESKTDPVFVCDASTVCQANSSKNQPGMVTLSINASPIEQLTITFPFNNQSPIAKAISTGIYNNLTAKNLGGLSAYFSATPVVETSTSTNTSLTFSTLCNSAGCPQP